MFLTTISSHSKKISSPKNFRQKPIKIAGLVFKPLQISITKKRANSFLPLAECTFLADKAHDVKAIYNAVHDIYNGDCFIALNKRNTKNPKKLPSGNIICEAGLAMHKDGKFSDDGRTRQKYCCPFKRSKSDRCLCNHKCWNNGKKNRGCTKYVTIPDDYRLSIDRSSIAFKSVYALRTEAERYNSRFKQVGFVDILFTFYFMCFAPLYGYKRIIAFCGKNVKK